MSRWHKRAFCDCGATFHAWKGELFFVEPDVCPKCGASKWGFKVKVVRWVSAVRTAMWPFGREITPARWQELGEVEGNG